MGMAPKDITMIKKLAKHPIGRLYLNIMYALDVLLNVLTLGDAREPVSSVLGKKELEGCIACTYLCKFLSFIMKDPDHCLRSIYTQVGYGAKNNWSPLPNLRRRWGNSYVFILLIAFYYKDELYLFVGNFV